MLLALLSTALAAPPTVRPPCGTLELLSRRGPAPRLPAYPPPPPAGDKEERDAYGTFPNQLVGTNFVIKWGNSGRVYDADAEALLDAFENAWTVELDEMGHPAPASTDRYLFNVYIGDTGDGTPDGYGAGGYFNTDDDGFPMIVVASATLADATWARGTATHEFYHAVQDVTGRYSYTGDSAWYWEATAMWIEGEVLADEEYDEYAAFLFGYALLPELPLYFFDYPDTYTLPEYHQYGAFIFPRYISEIAADFEVVRDSWLRDDLDADTPQDALAALLAERGIAFSDAFGDFAAHNATWDYADGELYDINVTLYGRDYRDDDHSVVAEVDSTGTDGVVEAPEDTLPERYGYNVVTLARPADGDLRVRFEGADEGSKESPADWRVTVVRSGPGGRTYVPIPLEGAAGEVLLEGVGDDDAVYLVAAAVPADTRDGETFAWSYAMTPEAAEDTGEDPGRLLPEQPEDTTACGCRASEGAPGALLGLAGVIAGLRAQRTPGGPKGGEGGPGGRGRPPPLRNGGMRRQGDRSHRKNGEER